MPKEKKEIKEENIQEAEETVEAVDSVEVSKKAEELSQEDVEPEIQPESTEDDSVDAASSDIPHVSSSSNGDDRTVTVQSLQFASFDDASQAQGETNKNLDILMDIKLQLTVELGRTELPIKKVLELTRGSIIELEKVAGEPVELYANGKLVAHGEVVVIEDNFGLRITSITEPEEILKGVS